MPTKKLVYSSNFQKNYRKRIQNNENLVNRFKLRIEIFLSNKNKSQIRDHKLVGSKNNMRAFSIIGDIRVVYTEYEDLVILLDIGTHSQVY